MLTLRAACLLLSLTAQLFPVSGSAAPRANKPAIAGYWRGVIVREGREWKVNVEFLKGGSKGKAIVDFPDIGGYGREFSVKHDAQGVRLERPQPGGVPIVFEGKLAGGRISGQWSGLGVAATFLLRRAKKPAVTWREEDVSFSNGDVTLSGTLLVPQGARPHPAVIFTHGSAAESRSTYRDVALMLVRRGVAALTYDKRGVGKSTGNWQAAGLSDLTGDALEGVRLLKARADIDAKRIGIFGHSQGGWIAPLAATRSADVAFVVVSAASAVNAAEQSVYHRENVMREAGFNEDVIAQASRLRRRMYETTKNGTSRDELAAEIEKVHGERWFEPSALPYPLSPEMPPAGVRELLFLEPEPVWEKVRVPVLAVWGDRDTVVPVERGRTIIEQALKRGGNKDYTTKVFPGVDHTATLVQPKGSAWDFPRRAPGYFEMMVDWIVKRVDVKS